METYSAYRIDEATRLIDEAGGLPKGWDIDSLNHLHTVVSTILHENDDQIDGRWSITFAELCRIILQERNQTKFEADHKEYVKIQAINRANQRNTIRL